MDAFRDPPTTFRSKLAARGALVGFGLAGAVLTAIWFYVLWIVLAWFF